MSKSPSAIGNINVALALKRAGYNSILDAQPEMRIRFEQLIRDDGRTVVAARRILFAEFPDAEWGVPSRQQLQVYIQKHMTQQVTVEPYLPDYTKMMKSFDTYKEQQLLVKEAKKIYQRAVAQKMSLRLIATLRKDYENSVDRLNQMETRMGLRRGMIADQTAMRTMDPRTPTSVINAQPGSTVNVVQPSIIMSQIREYLDAEGAVMEAKRGDGSTTAQSEAVQ